MSVRDRLAALVSPAMRGRAVATEAGVQGLLAKLPLVRAFWRRRQLPVHLRRPRHVAIEITAACNARCTMCPRHLMDRPMRPMNFDLFRKIVDECAAAGVVEIALNGYGEIFTLRRDAYREYIDYVRRTAPSVHLIVNTNGFEMDEAAARYLVEAGVHTVNTDIDAATAETFESIRRHLKLEQVEANLRRLVAIREGMGRARPTIRVGLIAMDQNRSEIPQFIEKWRGRVDYVGVDGLMNRMPGSSWKPGDHGRPCFDLWSKLMVWASGEAVLCCEDWNATHVVGDARTHTIQEIWMGAGLRKARELHLAGAAEGIPMCAGCVYWRHGPFWWFDDWN